MSVFLDLSGASGTAFFNLLTISADDGGLGMTEVAGDPTVFQITYTETAGQPATADRLNQLVNNIWPGPVADTQDIVVTALNGGNDPHSGQDITGNGVTFEDSTGASTVIRVVYDVSQCCGAGIALFDTGGNHITAPNPVILYHELSHAFRGVTGTNLPNDEPPAETDENVLRTQLGQCLRDVNNHNGDCAGGNDCGGSVGDAEGGPPSGGCGSSGGDGCFIVTATTGSPHSAEVRRLRQLRNRVSTASGLGSQLIDVIYREYFQFSPSIAARLEHDIIAKEVVLQIVVRPLLAWYSLAGALALEQKDGKALKQAVQSLRVACPPYLGASVAAMLELIRSGETLPPNAPRLLRDIAPGLRHATQLRYASWAILDPLIRAWTLATHDLGASHLAGQVGEWLASAPLEVVTPPGDQHSIDKELQVLESFFKFSPRAQKQLGHRLASAWPDADTALKRHGFM